MRISHLEEDAHELHDDGLQPHGDDDDGHEDRALRQAHEEVVFVGDAAGADLVEDLRGGPGRGGEGARIRGEGDAAGADLVKDLTE